MNQPETNAEKPGAEKPGPKKPGHGLSAASDIPTAGPLVRYAPNWALPYIRLARLDRLIGAWILVFPCWWSLVLARPGLIGWDGLIGLGLLFAAGALVMRSAGCVINDIFDRDIDRRVARTRERPIASGAVSIPQALVFLALLLAIGLFIVSHFNRLTLILAVSSLVLVVAYPFMKRITYWPQAWLGLTMTFGALLGFAAARGILAPEAFALYAGAFFWTLGYDTIYAYADRIDDEAAGVKSLSLWLGDRAKPWFTAFYTIAVALFAVAGILAELDWAFWPMLALVYGFLLWQAWAVDLDNPEDCMKKFRATKLFGWLLLAALIAGQWGHTV
jgi:4-hydroxybenzoate polyprenyltransferase